ncbi:MAG TPA: hypothetical protein VEW45_02830 [Candidatus Dormibacteraeota bacterium]|nr:hypothetical protein [Candidatus Dormibacteraeota bacterium]
MLDRPADPRTEDTIVFQLVRTDRSSGDSEVIGKATFADARSVVDAPEEVRVAVEELLSTAFVDRLRADERPRGYRRSGSGIVEMLVPGMPEHFIARLRGLWLAYPDGTVVTAREASTTTRPPGLERLAGSDAGAPVTDPGVRRATLLDSSAILNARPLVQANEPLTGLRPAEERVGVARTDCGWIT